MTLAELAVPIGTLPVIAAKDPADGLLERLRSIGHAVVVRDGRALVGFITDTTIQRLLASGPRSS